jgi:hypothetical protein
MVVERTSRSVTVDQLRTDLGPAALGKTDEDLSAMLDALYLIGEMVIDSVLVGKKTAIVLSSHGDRVK